MEDETLKHAKEYFNTKMILQKKKKKAQGETETKKLFVSTDTWKNVSFLRSRRWNKKSKLCKISLVTYFSNT